MEQYVYFLFFLFIRKHYATSEIKEATTTKIKKINLLGKDKIKLLSEISTDNNFNFICANWTDMIEIDFFEIFYNIKSKDKNIILDILAPNYIKLDDLKKEWNFILVTNDFEKLKLIKNMRHERRFDGGADINNPNAIKFNSEKESFFSMNPLHKTIVLKNYL